MALLGYTLIFCLFLCILRIAVLASICITQAFMMWKFINFQLRRWREHSAFQAPAVKKKPPVTKGRSSRKGTGLYSVNSENLKLKTLFFFFSCFGVLFIILLRFKILKRRVNSAAKSLQSCPTLCDPIDGSPPCSPVPGILQTRTWSGLSFPSPMHESEK